LLRMDKKGTWRRKSLSGVQRQSPGGALGAKPLESGNKYDSRFCRYTKEKQKLTKINMIKHDQKKITYDDGDAPISPIAYRTFFYYR